MKTKKQTELINSFLEMLKVDEKSVFWGVISYLSEIGYNPVKQRSYIVFNHDLHNKQIAKIGIRTNKDKAPFLAIRFSACRGYTKRFEKIVKDAIINNPSKVANCMLGKCSYCSGDPSTHVYTNIFENCGSKFHCGAYALEIPNISFADIPEIKKLLKEEHDYLMKHQVLNG